MSWLLDTDVISQLAKTHANARVVAWLEKERQHCYTSSIVIGQLAYWVRTKEGKQRQSLQRWLSKMVEAMEGRIHTYNVSVAIIWADLQRELDLAGLRMPIDDSYIAATARRHNLIVATGNERDFRRPGVTVFNPFKELPPS